MLLIAKANFCMNRRMVESSMSVDKYLRYHLCWKQNDNYAVPREKQE